MGGLVVKNIEQPDETRKFAGHGWAQLITSLPGVTFARATFQPGWKWSNDVKPLSGTDLCEVHHNGFVLSGRLSMTMADGTTVEAGPGDLFVCPPGHDAHVVGDEDCVVIDFSSDIAKYATK